MSRREAKLTLKGDDGAADTAVQVYEVRPKDVYNLYLQVKEQGSLPATEYGEYLAMCCNLTPEQLSELYPSELRQVLDAFKEVNADFLAPWPTVKKAINELGLTQWVVNTIKETGMLKNIGESLSSDLRKVVQDLQREVTEKSGNTVGVISHDALN